MAAGRKQISFDLNTKALEIYYPSNNWHNAYDDIKRHMKKNGFIWKQGSVYVSNHSMTSVNALDVVIKLVESHPWINVCMRDCVTTNVGREYSQNNLFNQNADIPKREEVDKHVKAESGDRKSIRKRLDEHSRNLSVQDVKETNIKTKDTKESR